MKNIDEALNLIEQVITAYRGTRQEHALLQQAMTMVREKLKPSPKPTKNEK